MKKRNRIGSLFLAVSMLLGLSVVPVYAEENKDASEQEDTPYVEFNGVRYPLNYKKIDLPIKKENLEEKESLLQRNGNFCGAVETPPTSYVSSSVTSAKNQGEYDTCWAFSATASAEASFVQAGKKDRTLDLSELQLIYFMLGGTSFDPLGNADGDGIVCTNSYWKYAGNLAVTMLSMANWVNGAEESLMPYSDIKKEFDSSYEYDYDIAHLQNARIIPFHMDYEDGTVAVGDNSDIKEAVMEYGALSISYFHANTWYNSETENSTDSYSDTYKSYYLPPTDYYNGGGHAATLVGWNDNYPKEQFSSVAPGNGAWLVKNSWGSSWGTDGDTDYTDYSSAEAEGYYWISYYDYGLASFDPYAYAFAFDDAEKYDNNYHYDGGAYPGSSLSLVSGSSVAANYKVSAAESEVVEAVEFTPYSENLNYSIQLYKIKSLSSNPTSGTALLSEPITGETDFAGLYTVDIPETMQPILQKGDVFSVVVTLTSKDDSDIIYLVDYTYEDEAGSIRYLADTSNDYTFYHEGDGQSFVNCKGYYTFRLKAFTSDWIPVTGVSLDKTATTLTVGDTETLTATVTPSNATNKTVSWESSNTSVATVSDSGLVTAKSAGTATITVTTEDGAKTAVYTVTVDNPFQITEVETLSASCRITGTTPTYANTVCVICAAYDTNGRQLSVAVQTMTAGNSDFTFTLPNTGKEKTVKVFLLDSVTKQPLANAISQTL